ncbi:uncharacterized protein E0L32_007222 [Thyridium curvatum]|uniref:separase n=1 Tax=Thyridium curvatum TaxID=1093900 RepID=A0A507AX88_9PEZI|nr:uncharacterized protein E0L32_007222 [Thyridium curvatum]TPX12107.1 hypothetical protein E0L32_007222 [Thyridium curvatum]
MASQNPQAEAVRTAIGSISTCTSATTLALKELLLPKEPRPENQSTTGRRTAAKGAATTTNTRTPSAAKSRSKKDKPNDSPNSALSDKEKAVLATEVVNAILKLLADASKSVPATPARRSPQDGELVRTVARNALRRSNSAPMTPLHARSLNRVTTSPVAVAKQAANSIPSPSNGCLAAVECGRVAFTALRTLQSSGKVTLPELQLEAGMSSFIGRLIGLGMQEQAVKELRVLKQRLDGAPNTTKKTVKDTVAEGVSSSQSIAEIINFETVPDSQQGLSLATTAQLQALRVLSTLKKPSFIEAALPFLKASKTSPLSLLLQSANLKGSDRGKIARQIENLSQLVLSLAPSIASKDDGLAVEPRLSVSPVVALELQVIGIEARLQWWALAKHQGDVDKDILSPLSRCLSAYVRRSRAERASYKLCNKSFEHIMSVVRIHDLRPSSTSKSPIASINQLLASVAREGGYIEEAIASVEKLYNTLDRDEDSAARRCSIAAQLLSLHLKQPSQYLKDETLLNEVLEGVQGPLKGDTTELEELLMNICQLRKSAMSLLIKRVQDEASPEHLLESHRHLLEAFVFHCPRFCLRWLGKPPASKSSTKDFLRYEQRRQLLSKSIHHILDSALVVAKLHIDERRIVWAQLDSVLQDSLTLLDYMGDSNTSTTSTSFYVKISHFYYLQYNTLRQQSTDPTDVEPLRALRKSIDCIRYRSRQEKERSQIIQKLERMAELCRSLGRGAEALGALQAIRSTFVEEGVLREIAESLNTQPPSVAWTSNMKSLGLSRSLAEISKLEQVAVDWTSELTEPEKIAVLEHQLHFESMRRTRSSHRPSLSDANVEALLRAYYPTQFPVRRYRTLLRLLATSMQDRDVIADIQSQINATQGLIENQDLGDDSSLRSYLPHYQNLYTSLTGLIAGFPQLATLEECLATWTDLVEAHASEEDLNKYLDGPSDLLAHLQSVADFTRTMGHETILTKVLGLSAKISKVLSDSTQEGLDLKYKSHLATHYVAIGESARAQDILNSGKQTHSLNDVSLETRLGFHLSFAEYFIAVGETAEAEVHLEQACQANHDTQTRARLSRGQRKALVAQASFLQSLASLKKGDSHHALLVARNGVKILFQEWSKLEKDRQSDSTIDASLSEDQQGLNETSQTDLEQPQECSMSPDEVCSPAFWALFYPLFRSLSSLSTLYAHMGMFQETLYYAEQANKIANSTGSSIYIASSEAWLGSVWLKAAKPDKSLSFLNAARSNLEEANFSSQIATIARDMGVMFGKLQDSKAEAEMMQKAQSIMVSVVENMAKVVQDDQSVLETKMARMTLKEKPAREARKPRIPAQRKPATKATKAKTKTTAAQFQQPPTSENLAVLALNSTIMVQKLSSCVKQRDWDAAKAIVQTMEGLPPSSLSTVSGKVARASYLLGYSIDQMARDAVFSVIQDSTLSFPAVASSGGDRYGRLSLTKQSPAGKTRAPSTSQTRDSAKEAGLPGFLESLREAQECLLEAHSIASVKGDAGQLHRISGMLQNAVVLISAACSAKPRLMSHPGFATCIVEMARNMTWRRERKVLLLEKAPAKTEGLDWPTATASLDARRSSLGFSSDVNRFQHDFIDIIPKDWSVVSISLSENKHDLYITRLQATQSPFVLRLPLERASSRDADNEVFNFQQGRSELLDIIEKANASCHDARDMSVKGAKSSWWAEREALDERLKDLLVNVEQIWLGGFKGIFSQQPRRADLHAKFQKGFQKILDKHLPSRRQVRGRRTKAASAPKVSLDPRILDLFVGLGDVTVPDCDLDDALNDLLYFVVDILQFHGERNAYDEIDFDSMVVETFDELHSYHSAINNSAEPAGRSHTILVLDKALHVFPWESLPCMQGQAVSRVPSLACLRRLILDQQQQASSANTTEDSVVQQDMSLASQPSGHHVSLTSGTYILNPSVDLKTTQATFDKPLASALCPGWKRIVAREPSEADFEAALTERDVLLYFGHGSGAQYIRGRTIRRLDKCRAAVLLMGCSSASLVYNGDFEVYGPAWNYMMAGCPAVVGTLWDVTDRDIDRLAGRLFEEWGLLARGTFAEKQSKSGGGAKGRRAAKAVDDATAAEAEGAEDASLVEAVTKARDACRFKYLTAAAVCVYGIPVFITRDS